MRTLVFLLALLAAPALAAEISLPDGHNNRVTSSCSQSVEKLLIRSEEGSWTLKPGEALKKASPAGTQWSLICGGSSVGTNCFFDGHVIIQFERGKMGVACYEGPMPTD